MLVDADYTHAIRELSAVRSARVGLLADQIRGMLAIALADVGEDEAATAILDENEGRPDFAWGRSYLLCARAEVEWAAGRRSARSRPRRSARRWDCRASRRLRG
jgi:hypothetical protein